MLFQSCPRKRLTKNSTTRCFFPRASLSPLGSKSVSERRAQAKAPKGIVTNILQYSHTYSQVYFRENLVVVVFLISLVSPQHEHWCFFFTFLLLFIVVQQGHWQHQNKNPPIMCSYFGAYLAFSLLPVSVALKTSSKRNKSMNLPSSNNVVFVLL